MPAPTSIRAAAIPGVFALPRAPRRRQRAAGGHPYTCHRLRGVGRSRLLRRPGFAAFMPAEPVSAVLHVTAAAGGGADRYMRDLAAHTPRPHFALHVGAMVDVLEDIRARRFLPLRGSATAGDALARWMRSAGIGIAHLHGVDEATRARLETLRHAHPLPYVVTLHDLGFVNPRAFDQPKIPDVDPAWIAQVAPTLMRASSVIAPSPFIRDLARRHVPGVDPTVVPPGIAAPRPVQIPQIAPDFALHAPRHVVAVVGAIGPHKGSGQLDALAAALEGSAVGIVVIGYTDTRLARGWLVPGRLYVHGPYVDGALAGWLAAYRAEVALFPNRLPESFSYTLSEVWAQGLPAVVFDVGALGERVACHGGGWRLPPASTAADMASMLVRLFGAEGAVEFARVESEISRNDSRRIPCLEDMIRDVESLYARFALRPAEAADPDAARDALAPLLAVNLDGFVFRKELVNLTLELEQAKARLAESQQWSAKLERDGAAWAAKLEGDIAELKREQERIAADNRRLADIAAAFDHLPALVRKFLLKRASRARS